MTLSTNDKQITVFATFTPKLGMEKDVLRVLQDTLDPTREEAGCLRFDLYSSTSNPKSFHLFEIFECNEAFEEHRRTPHYHTYRSRIEPLLEAQPHAVRVVPTNVSAINSDGSA